MAGIFKIIPKVGSLKDIDFKEPTAVPKIFTSRASTRRSTAYGKALREVKNDDLQTPDMDLDTGKPTRRGEYPLADATYRELLDELAFSNFDGVTPALRENILNFYDGFGFPPQGTRIDKCVAQRWRKTWVELTRLRSTEMPTNRNPSAPSPASASAALDQSSCGY